MAVSNSTELTCDLLRSLFDYDCDTGLFKRKACEDVSHIGDQPIATDENGYVRFRVSGKKYRAQRLVWMYVFGEWPIGQIDHINGIRADNRLGNLRDVSKLWNRQNQRVAMKNSQTGVLGIMKRGRKFRAEIGVSGTRTYLGLFATPEEASEAYLEAKKRLHPGHID